MSLADKLLEKEVHDLRKTLATTAKTIKNMSDDKVAESLLGHLRMAIMAAIKGNESGVSKHVEGIEKILMKNIKEK